MPLGFYGILSIFMAVERPGLASGEAKTFNGDAWPVLKCKVKDLGNHSNSM